MPSATDLITYIGIPLTILGLLPIFWNIYQSLLIRYRLSASIPPECRHFFDLIANPANGDVLVNTQTPFCENPGLWPKEGSVQENSVRQRLQSCRHRSFLKLIPKERAENPDPEKDASTSSQTSSEKGNFFETREFSVDKQQHLRRPWMSISSKIGFSPDTPEEFTGELWQLPTATSCIVNINLKIPMPPKLVMPWRSFVWFSLAIGVHPLDINSGQRAWELKCSSLPESPHDPRNKIRISMDGDDWNVAMDARYNYDFSIRRALAWNSVMCFECNSSLVCRSLAKPSKFKFDSEEKKSKEVVIDIHGQGKLCSAFFYLQRFPHRIHWDRFSIRQDNHDLNPNERDAAVKFPKPCAAAITWIFYVEKFDELKTKDLRDGLNKDHVISQGILEAQEKSLLALSQLAHGEKLKEELVKMLSRPSDTQSTSESTRDEELSVRSYESIITDTQDLVDRILGLLPIEFESSLYHKKTTEFLETIRSIRHQLENSPSDISAIVKTLSELLESSQSRTYTRSPEELIASCERMSATKKVVAKLKTYTSFSELEERFNPHTKMDVVVEESRFPSHESELMAHVILALQDWRDLRRTAWDLDFEPDITLKVCIKWLNDRHVPLSLIIKDLEDLEGYAMRGGGIFSAPAGGMVRPLLDDEKFPPAVYFV